MENNKVVKHIFLLTLSFSVLNLISLHLIPFIFPVASYTFIRCMGLAIIDKQYGYTIISILVIVFLLLGIQGLKKNKISLVVIGMAVYICDLIHAGTLFVLDFFSLDYINPIALLSLFINVIILVCLFFQEKQGKHHTGNIYNTEDGSKPLKK